MCVFKSLIGYINYGESKTTRITMATVRHVTAWEGLTKYQAA